MCPKLATSIQINTSCVNYMHKSACVLTPLKALMQTSQLTTHMYILSIKISIIETYICEGDV
ncbi:hypothetical protein Hanom_Chr15g01412741 [Helianthus anomalus]